MAAGAARQVASLSDRAVGIEHEVVPAILIPFHGVHGAGFARGPRSMQHNQDGAGLELGTQSVLPVRLEGLRRHSDRGLVGSSVVTA